VTRLELDIERDPDTAGDGLSVRGVVRVDDGSETTFVGWVGLLALLQRAVTTHDPAVAAPDEL
jgi:hypothetical protein